MKKNRSNNWTKGITIKFNGDNNQRFCLFEIDELGNQKLFFRILANYTEFGLSVFVHRTMRGWHFLSPTVVDLKTWKEFHDKLKDTNKKCPMLTLRILPNKYPNELEEWVKSFDCNYQKDTSKNSLEFCSMLHIEFNSELQGTKEGSIEIVRYPLPYVT